MRDKILELLYYWSMKPYQKWFKNQQPWTITKKSLLQLPFNSLGHQLGVFLLINNFELEAKLENHDVFHVLTATGVSVPDEITMQFYLLGNGKRSIYLFLVIATGLILYPEHWTRFLNAFKKGKRALPFYHLNYFDLLNIPLNHLQQRYLIEPNNVLLLPKKQTIPITA